MNSKKTPCDVNRAGEILGKSPAAIYMDVARKRVPHRKVGKRLYFFEEELLEFLNRQPGVSVDEAVNA